MRCFLNLRPPPHFLDALFSASLLLITLPLVYNSSHLLSYQFWSEGYREGIEEGKKESVQAGFNVGFREGATSGLAFGQCRGAAISVDIFAGQVPGSSEWKAKIAQTAAMVDHMTPRDAAKEAGMDFEKKYGNRDGDGDGVGDGKTESENTFAKKTADARAELESAGFKHRDFKLE